MSRAIPRTVVGAAAVAALVLAGCSGDGDADPDASETAATGGIETATAAASEEGPDPSATGEPEFTFAEADTSFLGAMLPSHDQGIEVARLVIERTERDDFRQLATDTLEFRESQTAALTDLADEAGASIDPADHSVDAPSVVPEEDVAALADADDATFDAAAAEVLARLDEGAVTVADQALATVEHPDVVVAAIDAIDRFEGEAETLRVWIGDWAG